MSHLIPPTYFRWIMNFRFDFYSEITRVLKRYINAGREVEATAHIHRWVCRVMAIVNIGAWIYEYLHFITYFSGFLKTTENGLVNINTKTPFLPRQLNHRCVQKQKLCSVRLRRPKPVTSSLEARRQPIRNLLSKPEPQHQHPMQQTKGRNIIFRYNNKKLQTFHP